jgi:hypothetical protein
MTAEPDEFPCRLCGRVLTDTAGADEELYIVYSVEQTCECGRTFFGLGR